MRVVLRTPRRGWAPNRCTRCARAGLEIVGASAGHAAEAVTRPEGRRREPTCHSINCLKSLETVGATSDTFRYYIIRETPYGADMSFSEQAMKTVNNADLADSFGNLFSRAVAMCKRYCGGKIPEEKSEGSFDLESTIKKMEKAMETYELNKMAEACISSVHDVNKYLTDREPWKMKDEKKKHNVMFEYLAAWKT